MNILEGAVLEEGHGRLLNGVCLPFGDYDRGPRFVVLEQQGDFVKVRINEVPVVFSDNVFWTFRVAAFQEPPDRFLSFVHAALKKGKGSTETFIKPDSGQVAFCPREPLTQKQSAPPVDCDKTVRTKGYIRADEYKLKVLNK